MHPIGISPPSPTGSPPGRPRLTCPSTLTTPASSASPTRRRAPSGPATSANPRPTNCCRRTSKAPAPRVRAGSRRPAARPAMCGGCRPRLGRRPPGCRVRRARAGRSCGHRLRVAPGGSVRAGETAGHDMGRRAVDAGGGRGRTVLAATDQAPVQRRVPWAAAWFLKPGRPGGPHVERCTTRGMRSVRRLRALEWVGPGFNRWCRAPGWG